MFDDEFNKTNNEEPMTGGDSLNQEPELSGSDENVKNAFQRNADVDNTFRDISDAIINNAYDTVEENRSELPREIADDKREGSGIGYNYNANSDNGGAYYNQSANSDNGGTYYNQNANSDNGGTYYNQNNQQGSYYNSNNNYSGNYNSNINGQKNPNHKKKKNAIVATAVIVAVALIGGITVVCSNILKDAESKLAGGQEDSINPILNEKETEKATYESIGSTGSTNSNAGAQTSGGVVITDVSGVVDNVMPSIVAITSTTIVESNYYNSGWPFGMFGYGDEQQEYEEVGAGSGIVVKQTDSELLIVTNNHVVTGADSLSIQFVNGTSINGVTKATDEDADIAIVSIPLQDIDSDTMKAIKIAELGSSDDLSVGEGVVAIGNALGYGQSVTTGVISAKDRDITVDDKTMTVLQTDAAINGGNSGGALLNAQGQVIGINVAKYSSSSYSGSASVEGMGFAIPISQATEIINTLMSKQTRDKVEENERGVLGIRGVDVDTSSSEAYNIPQGIYIKEVIAGGAAEKAGLRTTDVITKFDGQSVSSYESLQGKLEYYKAGEKVTLTIQRIKDGVYSETEIDVTLSKSNILNEYSTQSN